MFRQRQPAAPKPWAKAGRPADFINWTDYRWEPNAWRGAATMPWARHAPRRRNYTFLQVFLAGLAVVAGVKLMTTLRNSRNRSWLERSALAVLLLVVASYVSKQRRAS
jgi:hypothetical protein